MILNIYTDGGCKNNQSSTNIGGWGSILEFGSIQKEIYGYDKNTTNNKMELTAVIEALKCLKKDDLDIRIFSDSSYVCNCFKEQWYVKWQKNGWLNSSKKPVENKELWETLIGLTSQNKVQFFNVKGHVNLNHPNTDIKSHYNKFLQKNQTSFSLEEFVHITKMNNRADELANIGMLEIS